MRYFEIWLTDDYGRRISNLSTSLGLSATKGVGKVGWFSLYLPPSFNINLIRPDRMIQVWMSTDGNVLKLWAVYFLRKWTFSSEGSKDSILIEGPGILDLLRRRIVSYYSGTSGGTKSDYGDDMMKEVVSQSIIDTTTPAPDAGTRVWSNLSIESDVSQGPSVSQSFAFSKLMTSSDGGAIPNIAKACRAQLLEVFYDIIPNVVGSDSITFKFVTKINQPGKDVSDKIVFDQARGNLKNPSLTYDYSEEENYIYVGGQDVGAARQTAQVYDDTRYNMSIWNRCEGFADARNQLTSTDLSTTGYTQLAEGEPKINFSADLISTEGTQFFRDWDIGDRVTVKYRNIEFTSIIRAGTLTVDSKGSSITAKTEYNA